MLTSRRAGAERLNAASEERLKKNGTSKPHPEPEARTFWLYNLDYSFKPGVGDKCPERRPRLCPWIHQPSSKTTRSRGPDAPTFNLRDIDPNTSVSGRPQMNKSSWSGLPRLSGFSPPAPTFQRGFAQLTVTPRDGKRVTVGEDQRAKLG